MNIAPVTPKLRSASGCRFCATHPLLLPDFDVNLCTQMSVEHINVFHENQFRDFRVVTCRPAASQADIAKSISEVMQFLVSNAS
jgi:hypothetical protein